MIIENIYHVSEIIVDNIYQDNPVYVDSLNTEVYIEETFVPFFSNEGGGGVGIQVGAQSVSSGTVNFSNANGVTFGMVGSTVTASVQTNYLTSQSVQTQGTFNTTQLNDYLGTTYTTHTHLYQSTGNYLTTAMVSNADVSFVKTSQSSLFQQTSGMSNYQTTGNYLTTAMQSNAATISNIKISAGTTSANRSDLTFSNGNGVSFGLQTNGVITASVAAAGGAQTGISGLSAGTTQMTSGTAVFSNANGVSFGVNGNTITASVATNYLTTARASNDAIGLNTAGTNVTWTVNSGGISLNAGAYLTTAAQSNHSHNFATTTTNGALIVVGTTNSNGATIGVPAYLTTAQPVGAYITTARASNDAIGLNTALTANGVSVTANSSGLSLNFPAFLTTAQSPGAYLTTAMQSGASTQFVQANAAFNGTNASGTIASNGISISVNAGGGGVTPVASASNGSFSFTTLAFSNANNITFGTSAGSIITASVAAPGGGGAINISAGTTSNNLQSVVFANANNMTFGLGTGASSQSITASFNPVNIGMSTNGNTAGTTGTFDGGGLQYIFAGGNNVTLSQSANGSSVTLSIAAAGGGGGVTYSRYNEFKESPMVAGAIGQGSLHMQPWLIPNLHMDRVVVHNQFSNASNSSGSFTLSQWVGIYTQNVSTLSLLTSVSMNTNFTGSGTAGSYSLYGGIRALTMGLTTTLTDGMYWIGVIHRSTSGGANHTVSQLLNSNINSSYSGILGISTAASNQMSLGFGVYTASTTAMPASVAFTQINGQSSIFLRPPSLYFVSGTI